MILDLLVNMSRLIMLLLLIPFAIQKSATASVILGLILVQVSKNRKLVLADYLPSSPLKKVDDAIEKP